MPVRIREQTSAAADGPEESSVDATEEYQQDVEALEAIQKNLKELIENPENLAPEEISVEIFENIRKSEAILEEYDAPDQLETMLEQSGLDPETLKKALETYQDEGAKIDPESPAFDKTEHLAELYEQTLNMDGLSDEEKMQNT